MRIAAAAALPDCAALLDAVGRRSTAVTTRGSARRTLPGALRVWGLRGVNRERERSADAFARCCAVVDLGARGDEDDAAVGIRLARLWLRGAIGLLAVFARHSAVSAISQKRVVLGDFRHRTVCLAVGSGMRSVMSPTIDSSTAAVRRAI